MNQRIYKEYIKEIKTVFPVKGKQEREYIKKLSNDVADFCESENIASKEELYDNYGTPIEVVSHYFSAKGVPYVVSKIRISKYIKTILIAILTLAFISTLTYCIYLYQDHQITENQQAVIFEDVIE